MMRNRKQILYLGLAGLVLVLLAVLVYAAPRARKGAPGDHPPGSGPYDEHPTPALVANNLLSSTELLSKAAIEATAALPQGGRRIRTELMQWGAYLQKEQGAKVTSYFVAPARMVWVVQEFHPSYGYRHGTMTKATVTRVYDAQSGRLLHLEVRGEPTTSLNH